MTRKFILADTIVYLVLICVALSMVLPFVHETAKSFSAPQEVASGRVGLWPKEYTWGNYFYFYRKHLGTLARAYWNSTFITVVGVIWSTLNMAIFGFAVSRPRNEFRLTKPLMYVVLFSLVFSRPIIPYFLSVKAYGLMDTHWAIIFPHTIFPFQLILVISFFRQLPEELFSACRIDGGNDWHLLRHVALPLSRAVLMTISLFSAVILWNIFLHAMLFIRSSDLQPLQVFVRSIMQAGGDISLAGIIKDPFAETESTKSALVLLTTIPIALVYPLMQKYLAKGALLGAIKE